MDIVNARETALGEKARLTESDAAQLDRIVAQVNAAAPDFDGGALEVRLGGIPRKLLQEFCRRCRRAGWTVEKQPMIGPGSILASAGAAVPQVVGWIVSLTYDGDF